MTDNPTRPRLERLRRALPAVFGCVLTLFVIVALGDLRYFAGEAPAGWFLLLGVTTVGGISLGVWALMPRPWGSTPLKERRGVAFGYLLVGFVNLVSLGFFSMQAGAIACLLLPLPYAALLGLVYLRAYRMEDRDGGEVFP